MGLREITRRCTARRAGPVPADTPTAKPRWRAPRLVRCMAVLGLLCALGAPASAQKFTITGYDTLTFRVNSVSGGSAGQQAFTYSNYERQRQIENNAGLNITGYLFPRVILNATINSSRYTPDRSRYNLEYRGNGLNIMAGDINVAMSGNEFAPFNKSLRGMKVEALAGAVKLSTLLSQERAQVATDVFPGTNSPGPYSLRFSPIIDGTEQVRVDGQRKKLGVDYTIDYNTGMLWFQQTMIIPATSTIEVSYEYAAYGSNPGILAGIRGELPLWTNGRVGLTYLTQMSDIGSGTEDGAYRTDLFIGDNTPMVLTLRYRPVKRIVKITLDGVPQVENVDYEVQSLDSGIIRFRKIVPAPPGPIADAAPNLVVDYEIVTTSTPQEMRGDRTIVGLDGTFNLNERSSLTLHFARSGGAPARSGNALSIRGVTELGRVSLNLGYRDIGKQFAAIESVGFQQKERALEGNIEYRATDHLRFSGRYVNSSRPSTGYYYGTPSGDTDGSDPEDILLRATQASVGLTMDYPKLPSLSLQHQRYRTAGGSLDSSSAMTNMNLRYSLGTAIQLTANLDHNSNQDRSGNGLSASSLTQRYGASYTPGSRFSAQVDFTTSTTRSASAATSETGGATGATQSTTAISATNRASGASLTLTYSPISIATLTASYRISDSGSGGYGGYGGYGTSFGNSYYSSAYTSGSYMNSGNYSFGDQYTGSYYPPGSSYSSYTSSYGSSYTDYTSPLSGMPTIRSRRLDRAHAVPGRQEGDTDEGDSETGGSNSGGYNDTTGTRIRSINRSIGLQLTPLDRLNLSINYSNDLQEGQLAGSDSRSTNVGLGFTYSPWEILTLNGQLSRQRYTFLGAGGSSKSNIGFMGAQVGPFHRFTLHLNYQTMTSNTTTPTFTGNGGYGTGGLGDLTETGDGTTLGSTNYDTKLDTVTSRLEYPISQSRRLFTEWQASWTKGGGSYGMSTSPEDSLRLSAALGIEFSLNKYVNWQMDVRHIRYTDANNAERNYKGNLLTGEVRARF